MPVCSEEMCLSGEPCYDEPCCGVRRTEMSPLLQVWPCPFLCHPDSPPQLPGYLISHSHHQSLCLGRQEVMSSQALGDRYYKC